MYSPGWKQAEERLKAHPGDEPVAVPFLGQWLGVAADLIEKLFFGPFRFRLRARSLLRLKKCPCKDHWTRAGSSGIA
jgi:hypothetical protein